MGHDSEPLESVRLQVQFGLTHYSSGCMGGRRRGSPPPSWSRDGCFSGFPCFLSCVVDVFAHVNILQGSKARNTHQTENLSHTETPFPAS